MYEQDDQFGLIVDYDYIRRTIHEVYDCAYPTYNMLAAAQAAERLSQRDPNLFITYGASALAYSILLAAEEFDMANELKHNIFTLGWTEEHTGSDLLSIRTKATPLTDDPEDRNYHIQGTKWLINCSYHADYHVVLAKLDTELDGPRSLSFFLVPRSSVKSWERLETHVLRGMVLTKFDIDGPGKLVGKIGHGLSIVQRMAMPSKYQCTYQGICMMYESIPAALDWLNKKNIFGNNPIRFSNVFRQMYDLVLKSAVYDFLFHRAIVFNTDGFLMFNGTMLKSFLLLRINELLSKTWLVMGSKAFTKESVVGRDAIDSFVLPVFDGHYTINTFMTAKHAPRYLNSQEHADMEERLTLLREELFIPSEHDEIYATPKEIRNPPFYDYAQYLNQFGIPLDINPEELVQNMRDLLDEIDTMGMGNDPDYKYKTGDLIQWMESIVAATELWKLTGEDHYLNAIVIQYNGFVNTYNAVVSEGNMSTAFMTPIRQVPLINDIDDPTELLLRLFNVKGMLEQIPT